MNNPLWLEKDKKFARGTFEMMRRLNQENRITEGGRAYMLAHVLLKRAYAHIAELREALEACARKLGDHCESEYLSGTGESTYKEFTGLLRRATPPEKK